MVSSREEREVAVEDFLSNYLNRRRNLGVVKGAKSDASCQIRSKVVGVVKQQLAFRTVRCHNTRARMMTHIR